MEMVEKNIKTNKTSSYKNIQWVVFVGERKIVWQHFPYLSEIEEMKNSKKSKLIGITSNVKR
jgi:hypothetical protein